jgi:hypothetical protein
LSVSRFASRNPLVRWVRSRTVVVAKGKQDFSTFSPAIRRPLEILFGNWK